MLHIFHKYTAWKIIQEGNILDRYDNKVGTWMLQQRQCIVCGFVQRHKTDKF